MSQISARPPPFNAVVNSKTTVTELFRVILWLVSFGFSLLSLSLCIYLSSKIKLSNSPKFQGLLSLPHLPVHYNSRPLPEKKGDFLSLRGTKTMAQAVEEWYKQMPIITRSYLTAAIITTVGCSLEVIFIHCIEIPSPLQEFLFKSLGFWFSSPS